MRFYGKTFGEVYQLLPRPYRAVVILGIAFLLFIVIHLLTLALRSKAEKAVAPVVISGLQWEYSIYDPALGVDPAAGKAYLAFSNIRTQEIDHRRVVGPGIRLAVSDLSCERWVPLTAALTPQPDTVTAPDGKTTIASGMWRYETPALVHDPDDPGREWKLYAYKYMWTGKGSVETARRYGFIVAQYASDPAQEWSSEEWAFSPAPDYPPPPYQDMVKTHLNGLDPSLAGVTMYTRPSVIYMNGIMLMSLSAFTNGATADRVVLFLSPDHGRSWTFAGTVLTAADAPKAGPYTTLGGATLLKQGEHVYLAAVFGDGKVAGLGTSIFGFDELSRGLLRRDGSGAPVLLNRLPRNSLAPTAVGGGYAAYDDKCETGILTGEYSGLKNAFQIFKTRRKPVEK